VFEYRYAYAAHSDIHFDVHSGADRHGGAVGRL
jgi:hypothetical protein